MGGQYFRMLDWLAERGKKIFVDLKFFDIPATVAAAVRQLRNRGVTFTTVHGNQSIMQAAAVAKGDVKILAVTVLTSLDRGDLDDLGFQCDVEKLVLSRARRALASRLRWSDGVFRRSAQTAQDAGSEAADRHPRRAAGG